MLRSEDRLRRPVLISFILSLGAFILSLIVLLSGAVSKPESGVDDDAILTYDVSNIGLNELLTGNSSDSPYQANISAIIGTWQNYNGSTYTHQLGIADWYSFHYLATCQGYWTPDPQNSTFVIGKKMKANCTRQHIGYDFDLSALLAKTVNPSFQDLVLSSAHTNDGTATYQFKIQGIVWTVGTAFSGAAAVLLIFMWDGRVHLNQYPFFLQLVAWACLLLSNTLATIAVFTQDNEIVIPMHSKLWLGESWAAVLCLLIALFVQSIEWGLQRMTPPGETVNSRHKDPNVSWVSINWKKSAQGLTQGLTTIAVDASQMPF